MQTVHIIKDAGALSKAIKSIATRSKKLDHDLHSVAVSALHHAFEHGSTAPMLNLLDAIGKSQRKGALKNWLDKFGCFMVKETGTVGIDPVKRKAGFKEADAIKTPFWELTADTDGNTQLSSVDMLNNLLKRLTSAKAKGKLDAHGDSVIAALQAAIPATHEATQNA